MKIIVKEIKVTFEMKQVACDRFKPVPVLWFTHTNITQCLFCLPQVDGSVFASREMVQSLAFGLSFLQRMDMKSVVVMGRSEYEDTGPTEPVAGSLCTQGLVERSQQLTEALQQHSASVLPLFSAESFLLLHEAPRGSR